MGQTSNILGGQLQKFINSYEDNPRLDGEQLLYLYSARVEVQDNKTLEMFNSFAAFP